jgi:ribonuclease HII
VGAVVVDDQAVRSLPGVRDSKLLSAARREALVPAIRSWAAAHAVGSTSADEIDRFGINVGLRLAALRALAQLPVPPDLVLLDGSHDWLSPPVGPDPLGVLPDSAARPPEPLRVVTRVRGDRTCTSVAAASVLAKVARDAVMVELARAHPGYGWEVNKGYGTAAHLDALARLGPTPQHRMTWNLAVPA